MTTEPSQPTNTGEKGLLTLDNVVKHFDISGGLLDQLRFQNGRITRQRTTVKAVNNVSFTIAPGETFSPTAARFSITVNASITRTARRCCLSAAKCR